ncbi:hypothetical protein [Candidatus Methylacidiphilum infernorum]|uniref:hypothetical protein n=1 Tax=Candidatus Methylacidiphilum infernorum TaxID=511746 RepID=UPI00031244A4|nr:hypothetical protein [Candidatus Methylacidiphilum infernorum]
MDLYSWHPLSSLYAKRTDLLLRLYAVSFELQGIVRNLNWRETIRVKMVNTPEYLLSTSGAHPYHDSSVVRSASLNGDLVFL